MFDWDERRGDEKWIRAPKVGGDPLRIEIKKLQLVKTEGKSKFNFQKTKKYEVPLEGGGTQEVSGQEDMGYHLELETPDGKILSIANWGLFFALQTIKANDGMVILIKHPERGNWEVENLSETPETPKTKKTTKRTSFEDASSEARKLQEEEERPLNVGEDNVPF